jgi:hypothetical protein
MQNEPHTQSSNMGEGGGGARVEERRRTANAVIWLPQETLG